MPTRDQESWLCCRMTNESHEGRERPGARRWNQKMRMTTSFVPPPPIPKQSNLSDAAHLFAKVTFCGLSSRSPDCRLRACWIRVRLSQNFLLPHKSLPSSYVLCKGAKVNHANDHLLCSVCFFPLCKFELAPVWSLSDIVISSGKMRSGGEQHGLFVKTIKMCWCVMVFTESRVGLLWFVQRYYR